MSPTKKPPRIFINNENRTTVVCPKCGKSKSADVSDYLKFDKAIKVKCKCKCGYSYTFLLERRKNYRKNVNLPGTYVHVTSEKRINRGLMTVKDISRTGLKLMFNREVIRNFNIGDTLRIEFRLDDRERSFIRKKVTIKTFDGSYAGVEFSWEQEDDKALGFYLFI